MAARVGSGKWTYEPVPDFGRNAQRPELGIVSGVSATIRAGNLGAALDAERTVGGAPGHQLDGLLVHRARERDRGHAVVVNRGHADARVGAGHFRPAMDGVIDRDGRRHGAQLPHR